MKVILSGATGFLGEALLNECERQLDDITVIVRKDSLRQEKLTAFHNVKVVSVDMMQAFSLPEEGYDVFYHLAWGGGRNDREAQELNKIMSTNCVEAAIKSGCKRVVVTGSQAEYGEVSGLITEETPCNPTTEYGRVKNELLFELKELAYLKGFKLIWPRVFSVYGEHDNPNTLWSGLIKALTAGCNYEMNSDGKHYWNFLYEEDAARAIRLLGSNNIPEGIYNVASKYSHPLREYVEKTINAVGSKAKIIYGKEKCKVNLNVYPEKLLNTIGEYEYNGFPVLKGY